MLISRCSCAPWYFCVDIFCIFRVIAPDFVKIYNFRLVSHVAWKIFYLEIWNFTGMLISMWSCAPWYFHVDMCCIFRVIALDLVKIYNVQLVSHITQKVFDLVSWNFIEMLISMCSRAHGYFKFILFCQIYCPWLSENWFIMLCYLFLECLSAWVRINQFYRSGGMAEWLTLRTSNLMIASRMGSNPVRGKSLIPWARKFTLIAQNWLVPGTDWNCVYKLIASYTIELK
jgi:hypothetical protein